MNNVLGTEIFWITLIITPILLLVITFFGSIWCKLIPNNFRSNANLYLAPVFGLATLIIISSIFGQIIPMGSLSFPLSFFILLLILIWVFITKKELLKIIYNSLIISIFGIICGVTVLVPLFFYGAFNPHNDAFTYLVHSDWLQNHAFNEKISAENVTPLTTQISIYQTYGLRMGGSFLLALAQSLFHLPRSFQVYPAVIIIAITACCLAIGFPIAQTFPKIKRIVMLALVSLPSLSLGGLVFGANLGFLPQTIGLALGVGFLVTLGFSLHLIIKNEINLSSLSRLSILSALLFSGAVYAYSEIMPFLLATFFISGIFCLVRSFIVFKNILIFSSGFSVFTVILLNFEIIRILKALLMQSGAVVGSPVAWPLAGYIFHALGIHGGAWDIMQWSNFDSVKSFSVIFGLFIAGLLIGILIFSSKVIWKHIIGGALMPIFVILLVFIFGFVYFRYFVPSPFQLGTGQSWSQFKLSDWINPFWMVLLLFSLAALQSNFKKIFNILIFIIFAICLTFSTFFSFSRIEPIINTYKQTKNLDKFYANFRDSVNAICPNKIPVYLNLDSSYLKFKQMALLHLYDREVKSDWTNDGYIYPHLLIERRKQEPAIGDCVVESNKKSDLLELYKKEKKGLFNIGIFRESERIRIADIIGAYGNESDGENYWNWVKNKITFKVHPIAASEKFNQTKVFFEYESRGSQILNVDIIKDNGTILNLILQSSGNTPEVFDKIIDVLPSQLSEIVIRTNSGASRLNENDPRIAAFIIRNIKIQQYKKEQ